MGKNARKLGKIETSSFTIKPIPMYLVGVGKCIASSGRDPKRPVFSGSSKGRSWRPIESWQKLARKTTSFKYKELNRVRSYMFFARRAARAMSSIK